MVVVRSRRARRALVTLWLAAACSVVGWSAATTPAAAAAKTVEVTIEEVGGVGRLVPASVTVAPGDTIRFANRGTTAYRVAIDADGYSAFLMPGADTGTGVNDRSYVAPDKPGTRAVALTTPDPLRGEPSDGQVTVARAGSQPATGSPHPTQSAAPGPTTPASPHVGETTPPVAPSVVPVPTVTLPPLPSASPRESGSPPALALPTLPGPGMSPSGGAVAGGPFGRGPLEPVTRRALGLPAALAAVLITGTAGAIGRVLLAEPVAGERAVSA